MKKKNQICADNATLNSSPTFSKLAGRRPFCHVRPNSEGIL